MPEVNKEVGYYKVRFGKHKTGRKDDSRVYEKNEVVESDSDLCARFPNKFKKLSPEEARAHLKRLGRKPQKPPAPPAVEENDEEEDLEDQQELEQENQEATEDDLMEAEAEEAEEEFDFGEDVTLEFGDEATNKNATVHREGRDFWVVRDNQKMNDSPLKRSKVSQFLNDLE